MQQQFDSILQTNPTQFNNATTSIFKPALTSKYKDALRKRKDEHQKQKKNLEFDEQKMQNVNVKPDRKLSKRMCGVETCNFHIR